MVKRAVVLCLILIAGAVYLARASRTEPVPIRRSLDGLPMLLGGWSGQPAAPMDPRVLAVLGVDDYLERYYAGPGGARIGLYIGYYQSQRQGDTIHSPLNCLPGGGWNPVVRTRARIPVQSGGSEEWDGGEVPSRAIEANSIVIQKGLDRQVVIYWYQSQGRVIASEYWGKIYTVLDAIRTNRTDAAMVRIIAQVNGSDDQAVREAQNHALAFAQGIFPYLSSYLPD